MRAYSGLWGPSSSPLLLGGPWGWPGSIHLPPGGGLGGSGGFPKRGSPPGSERSLLFPQCLAEARMGGFLPHQS